MRINFRIHRDIHTLQTCTYKYAHMHKSTYSYSRMSTSAVPFGGAGGATATSAGVSVVSADVADAFLAPTASLLAAAASLAAASDACDALAAAGMLREMVVRSKWIGKVCNKVLLCVCLNFDVCAPTGIF